MPTTPAVVQRFVDMTNAGDPAGFLACFTDDAYLNDWGSEYRGRDGVARWNETDNIGVKSHLRIVAVAPEGGTCRVIVAVSGGGFNGEGTMTFTLSNDRISQLIVS